MPPLFKLHRHTKRRKREATGVSCFPTAGVDGQLQAYPVDNGWLCGGKPYTLCHNFVGIFPTGTRTNGRLVGWGK